MATVTINTFEDLGALNDLLDAVNSKEYINIAIDLMDKYGKDEAKKRFGSSPYSPDIFKDLAGKHVLTSNGIRTVASHLTVVKDDTNILTFTDEPTIAYLYDKEGWAKANSIRIFDIIEPTPHVNPRVVHRNKGATKNEKSSRAKATPKHDTKSWVITPVGD